MPAPFASVSPAVVISGRGPIQLDFDPNRFAVLSRTRHEIRESETLSSGSGLQSSVLKSDLSLSIQGPLVQSNPWDALCRLQANPEQSTKRMRSPRRVVYVTLLVFHV